MALFLKYLIHKFEYKEQQIHFNLLYTGSDTLINEQPYRYLTADLMKSLRDDSLPIDVTRDDPIHRQGKIFSRLFFSLPLSLHNPLNSFSISYKRRKERIYTKQ